MSKIFKQTLIRTVVLQFAILRCIKTPRFFVDTTTTETTVSKYLYWT